MRWRLAASLAVSLSAPAFAQVTVNPGALELLPQAPARQTPPARTPARPATPPGRTPARPNTPAPTPPVPPARPPAVPVTPPEILALPPVVQVPVARPPPIPIVPVLPDAPGTAARIQNGLRVTFGAERSDLNPATEAAMREYARSVRANDQATVNIYAYAAGSADDASTSRRLSLARALAARAVLINEGIASTRIYPRALGSTGGDTAPDRVDVVSGAPGPPTPPAPEAPSTSGAPGLAPPPAPR